MHRRSIGGAVTEPSIRARILKVVTSTVLYKNIAECYRAIDPSEDTESFSHAHSEHNGSYACYRAIDPSEDTERIDMRWTIRAAECVTEPSIRARILKARLHATANNTVRAVTEPSIRARILKASWNGAARCNIKRLQSHRSERGY